MAKGRIHLLSTIPGPSNLGPIVREFSRKEGVVTAFSDSAVKMLAGLMPEESGIEAIPFGGLVRRFASFCGEMPLPVAHQGHTVAAIGAACEELPPDSPFAQTAHRQGLHKAIAETLHELSEYGMEPEEYERVAALANPILADKLRSLAILEREAAETLGQLGRTFSREHYKLCQDSAPERGAELGRVLVLAGGEFSPQAVGLLQWAVAHGAQVTVVVYRHATGGDLFHGAKLTVAALAREPELTGEANQLLRHLFAETASKSPDIRCTVVSAADPLAETEWALRGCLERKQNGMRFEDMALYVRDADSYAPLIEASAKRLGVDVRMWRRAPLMTNSFARLTQAALDFCVARDVRALMPLARTTYANLNFETRTALQDALKAAYGAKAEQWQTFRCWLQERQGEFEWIEKLLDWRQEAISTSSTLEAWIGNLYQLMINLPQSEGTIMARERDKRALFVLQRSLSQIASVRRLRGARSISLHEFARYAKEVWADADVSVPAGEHGVLVTSQSESLRYVPCLFVLGMLEGVFPRRRTEDPILSDFDREEISRLRGGVPLPLSRDKAEAERDQFYTVCAAAGSEIVFSYPETDEERDNVPAFYLGEVERALGGMRSIPRSRQNLTPPMDECLALSDKEISAAMAIPQRSEPAQLRFANPFTAKAFERDADVGLQPRELREALQCPFSFFARRTLKLEPERLRARWFSLVRLPQAANLSTQPSPEEACAALDQELDKQLDMLYTDIPEWEISLLRSGGRRLIREWVEREFTARRIWPKESVRPAAWFGNDGLRETLPNMVKLKGSVAGTSRSGPYSVVHLVETSGPAKGYGAANDLSDDDKLYYGVHLLASFDQNSRGALEIETMAGERLLMLLPRVPGSDLPARVQEGLKVIDLGGGEESGGPRVFFKEVRELVLEAVRRIDNVDVRAIRGDHCAWCDYGELCRQSLEFGEEDSPFADEL